MRQLAWELPNNDFKNIMKLKFSFEFSFFEQILYTIVVVYFCVQSLADNVNKDLWDIIFSTCHIYSLSMATTEKIYETVP